MKKFLLISTAVLMMAGVTNRAMAQDTEVTTSTITSELAAFAIINVENNTTPPSLELVRPLIAGAKIEPIQDNGSWINITSVKDVNNYFVTAAITSGVVHTSTVLEVTAAGKTGESGYGNFGISGGIQTLSATPETILTDIGTCYTGIGNNTGYNLTYKWSVTDTDEAYKALLAKGVASDIIITYTIDEL